mmetsp:Transcript_17796/g.44139  ORF Transcript_17796/g.44139 Transcript_17796/m.44139 type:complete len:219 (-) Transcript_17796:287-943(-)
MGSGSGGEKKGRVHKLWVVRHGETEFNKKSIIQGQNDVPLSEEGHRQALKVGKWLSKFSFDTAICSDLPRTRQTMGHILAHFPSLQVKYDERIRERHCGKYTAQPRGTIDKVAVAEGKGDMLRDYRPDGGGESLNDVKRRGKEVAGEIEELFKNAEKSTVMLMVSHGRFMVEFFKSLMDVPPRNAPQNTSVYRFAFNDSTSRWSVEMQNQTDHLHRPL